MRLLLIDVYHVDISYDSQGEKILWYPEQYCFPRERLFSFVGKLTTILFISKSYQSKLVLQTSL